MSELPQAWAGRRIHNYELGPQIGGGGGGKVYIATEITSERIVAFKLALPGSPNAEEVFQDEIRKWGALSHEHIVGCLASGVDPQGCAYLVLELMAGGTLAENVKLRKFQTPREALEIVYKVTTAVQYAHERAILHCDLKPENILLDDAGEPHVGDFGLAQRLYPVAPLQPRVFGGTPGWMSPEQARLYQFMRRRAPEPVDVLASTASTPQPPPGLTVASDVFSLGVLLYWLLRGGELPFGNGSDYLERVQLQEAKRPLAQRKWALSIEADANAICLRALTKEPYSRYRTAADLARDVRAALRSLPLGCEARKPFRRLLKGVARHRLLTALSIPLFCLIVYMPFVPLLMLGESQALLDGQNKNAALYQAGAVMNEVRAFTSDAQRMASDPGVIAITEHTEFMQAPAALLPYANVGATSIIVLDLDGALRVRLPIPATSPARTNYAFRDYFQGALKLADVRQPYVARVIRSAISGMLELHVSVPLVVGVGGSNPRGTVVGVLSLGRQVRSTFGAVQMNCTGSGICMTALLGPRDRDAPEQGLPEGLSVVAAPGLAMGLDVVVSREVSQRVCAKFGCAPSSHQPFDARPDMPPQLVNFADPITGEAMRGAFAPVGSTGLIVVNATPLSSARAIPWKLLNAAVTGLGFPMLGSALLALFLFVRSGAVPSLFQFCKRSWVLTPTKPRKTNEPP